MLALTASAKMPFGVSSAILPVLVLQLVVGGNQGLCHQLSAGKLRALCQLLFHGVERRNVLQLPLQRRLAGKAHHQQAETVPVHKVGALGSAVAVRRFGLKKHLPKIGDIFFDCVNVTNHMIVALFKVLSDLAAGRNRLAILGR